VLAEDECVVWWSDPRGAGAKYVELLDDIEKERLKGLRFAADQARFLTAAALLRMVVALETGVTAREVHVDRSCPRCHRGHGRPRLPTLDLHVSVTHSADRVAVALTRLAPVGVDVELIDHRDISHLAAYVLAADERAENVADFYRYWTRKESVVKATGDGIVVGLPNVRVSRPSEGPRLLSYPGCPKLQAAMRDLTPGDNYVAALAVLSADPVTVREHLVRDLPGSPSLR
jgi:4'-phosphopantetheinyl transferase